MSLETRKEALRKEIARKERHLASLDAMPDLGALVDGTVLALSVTLGRSRPYTFIGYKAAGKWFLTGERSPNGVDSEYLAEWLISQGRALASATVLAEIETVVVVDLGATLDALIGDLDRDEMLRTSYPDNFR